MKQRNNLEVDLMWCNRSKFSKPIWPAFVFLVSLFVGTPSIAADHRVAPSTSAVDCNTFSGGVVAGDTLTMDDGKRGSIKFRNCVGSASKPIVIRNDTTGSGPTIVQRTSTSSGGFSFTCTN